MSADDGSCSTVTESPRAASPEGEAPAESPTGGQKCALPSPPPSPSCLPPAAKRSRRAVQKRVVSVQLGDAGADHRPKGGGEGPPPPDSWAWRKYGQKPIKGSPYPRGYYRCSSSKGCPARKQVERSRADPTVLLVTYTFEHNHPWPLPKNQSHPNKPSSRPPAAQKPEQPAVEPGLAEQAPEPELVQEPQPEPEPEPERERQQKFVGLVDPEITTMAAAAGGEEESFNCWFDQPSWDSKLYAPVLLGALDVAAPPPEDWDGDLQGEDALFAGLGELPECAVVFGRRRELGLAATAPWCS